MTSLDRVQRTLYCAGVIRTITRNKYRNLFMGLIFRSLAMLLSISLPFTAAGAPQRIVSIGLCTDQLLLLLAEREQIASLSVWAVDDNMSFMIDAVGNIPLNNSSVEDVVRYRPDLVLTSRFAAWNTARFLRQLGYEVREIPQARSIAEIYTLLRQVGGWIGKHAAAEAMIDDMRRRLDEIRRRHADRPQKSVIVYSPNGFTIGANTLEDDLFRHAGYRNLAADMGIDGFRQISLEKLVAADPDVLQIDRSLSRQDSLATAHVGHPVLDKLVREREYLDIPTRLRICAGPMIVEAIEMMARRR